MVYAEILRCHLLTHISNLFDVLTQIRSYYSSLYKLEILVIAVNYSISITAMFFCEQIHILNEILYCTVYFERCFKDSQSQSKKNFRIQ